MVISFKGMLGIFFWSISATLCGLAIAYIAYFSSGEWKKPKKKKYEGQPIVVKGGKKDAK